MVDPERLARVLARVSDDVSQLRAYAGVEPAVLLGDAAALGHVKYLFITAVEGCLDAAQHVCASEGWGPPDTNADAMRVLHTHDVLGADLAESMARAVGFRNLLVHGYRRIEDTMVVDNLGRLDDIDRFCAAVLSAGI